MTSITASQTPMPLFTKSLDRSARMDRPALFFETLQLVGFASPFAFGQMIKAAELIFGRGKTVSAGLRVASEADGLSLIPLSLYLLR